MSYEDEELELWNVVPGMSAVVGPQSHFNVVGRVRRPQDVERLRYWINGHGPRPVHFACTAAGGRLQRAGDFNIDTLDAAELKEQNELTLEVATAGGSRSRREIRFGVRHTAEEPHAFKLDLHGEPWPAECGQVVDGHWRTESDENGELCLAIRPEDHGYDRIILFGHAEWTYNYEVLARLSPTQWHDSTHNLGLLFRWNPHDRGDGTTLPTQWTTGLGYYYCSNTSGLRLRFGVDVHLDENRIKQGDHVLAERPFSLLRQQLMRPQVARLRRRLLGDQSPLAQLRAGRQFWFRLRVAERSLAFSVWERGAREPKPQLTVSDRVDVITKGAVGVIVYNCAARIYEYEVRGI